MATVYTFGTLDLFDNDAYFVTDIDIRTVGQVVIRLDVTGADLDAVGTNFEALNRELNRAIAIANEGAGALVECTIGETSTPLDYLVTGGTLTPGSITLAGQEMTGCMLRLETYPYPLGPAVTATLDPVGPFAGGDATFLVAGVEGDEDALVDLTITDASSSGALNYVLLTRRAGSALLASSFDPWIAPTAIGGAASVADPDAMGGTAIALTSSATATADLARVVLPDALLYRGMFDLFALVKDTATALGAPSGLGATVTTPLPTVRQTPSGTGGTPGSTSVAANWTLLTLSGSTLVAVVHTAATASDTSGTLPLITMPPQWTLVGYEQDIDITPYNQTAVFVIEGAGATSGTVTASFSSSIPSRQIVLFELANTPSLGALISAAPQRDGVTYTLPVSEQYALVIAGGGHGSSAASGTAVNLSGGYGIALNHSWAKVGYRPLSSPGTAIAQIITTPAAQTGIMAAFRGDPTNAAGQLEPGSYTARVQALDAVGTVGNASSSVAFTITYAGSIPTLSWTAPSGSVANYRITVQYGTTYWSIDTPDASTSFEITTLAGATPATGLPATVGAAAPPGSMEVRIGTEGGVTKVVNTVDLTGANAYRLIRLAGGRDLPPVAPLLDGSQPVTAIELAITSTNGLSITATVDALFLAANREPQMEAQVDGLAATTNDVWHLQTHPSGRGMTGWRVDATTGDEVGTLKTRSAFTLRPGDNIVSLLPLQASGTANLAATSLGIALSYRPRYRWQKGGA